MVLRPSDSVTPSARHVPGYSSAVAGVGMFGDGGTHGVRGEASACRSRAQPSTSTTCSSTSMPRVRTQCRASSPTVRECRTGIAQRPTSEWHASSRTGPSASAMRPPSGLGRSSTTTAVPAAAHASSTWLIVHT